MTRQGKSVRTSVVVLLALLVTGMAAPLAARAPYRTGDTVRINGRVTGADGGPLGEVTVLLEVSRTAFKLRRFRREKGDTLQVSVTADEDGRFAIDWRWDSYYNTFELAVALPVRRDGRDSVEIFTRVDVTEKVRAGSPVSVALEVENSGYLQWLREFLAGLASEDEIRIYREMGRPDRVDKDEGGEAPESAWWYFEAGRVYRFRAGELEQVTHFEPVKPL